MSHGAQYHGDLTKMVTHLIVAHPSGSKYEHAISWGMKVVTWEWLKQSCERGMALDESYYDPKLPVEARGVGAWDRRRSTSPMIGKRMREAEQPGTVLNPLRRKLRRAASTRLSGQTEAFWAGITAVAVEKQTKDEDDWTEDPTGQPQHEQTATSAEAFADKQPRKDPASRPRGPFADDHDGIFEGRLIFLRGFDNKKVRMRLPANGQQRLLMARQTFYETI